MTYKITPYTYKQAERLNVTVKPSIYSNKKIDVFKDGKYLVSVGQFVYDDYATLLSKGMKKLSEKRRELYRARHANNTGLAGFYALNLLW